MTASLKGALVLGMVCATAAFAPSGTSLGLRSNKASALCSASVRRQAPVSSLRMQQLTEAEMEEYKALLARAGELKETYRELLSNAMPPEAEPVPEEVNKPKGFAFTIEEAEEDDTPMPEPEPVDLSAMTEDERAWYERNQAQSRADTAYELAEELLKQGDRKGAMKQHKLALKEYHASGILTPGSIFAPSFAEALDGQRVRIKGVQVVSTATAYSKNKQPWDL